MIGRLLSLAVAAIVASLAAHPAAAEPRHSGPYIGIAAGYGMNALKPENGDFEWASAGATGGLFAGFGGIVNGLYMGVEADAMVRDIKAKATDLGTTVTASNDYLGTVRLRVGMPIGPALLYGTGGVAVTQSKLDISAVGSDKALQWGAVVGAGIEVSVTQTMFVRLEGRHTRFFDQSFDLGGGVTADVAKQGENTIIGGLGFRF